MRQRAQSSHDHHRGLKARFRGQTSSPSRGSSNSSRHALLGPSSAPPDPAERRPEAARHAHGGGGSPIDLELDGDGARPSNLRRLVVGRRDRLTGRRRRRWAAVAAFSIVSTACGRGYGKWREERTRRIGCKTGENSASEKQKAGHYVQGRAFDGGSPTFDDDFLWGGLLVHLAWTFRALPASPSPPCTSIRCGSSLPLSSDTTVYIVCTQAPGASVVIEAWGCEGRRIFGALSWGRTSI